jgi:hypothetical protein
MNGQDGFAGRLTRQRGGHLLAAQLGQQLVGADQQEAAGRLEHGNGLSPWSRPQPLGSMSAWPRRDDV